MMRKWKRSWENSVLAGFFAMEIWFSLYVLFARCVRGIEVLKGFRRRRPLEFLSILTVQFFFFIFSVGKDIVVENLDLRQTWAKKNMSGTDGQVSWSAVIRLFFPSTKQIDKLLTFFAYFLPGQLFSWDFTSWGDIYAYPPLPLSFSLHPFLCFCWRDMIISSWAEAEKAKKMVFLFRINLVHFPECEVDKAYLTFLKNGCLLSGAVQDVIFHSDVKSKGAKKFPSCKRQSIPSFVFPLFLSKAFANSGASGKNMFLLSKTDEDAKRRRRGHHHPTSLIMHSQSATSKPILYLRLVFYSRTFAFFSFCHVIKRSRFISFKKWEAPRC